jgi:hypothetical protein
LFYPRFCNVVFSYTVGALADSYYEYLLKVWLLGGKADENQWRMFSQAAAAIEKQLVRQTAGGMWYATPPFLQYVFVTFGQVHQRVKRR